MKIGIVTTYFYPFEGGAESNAYFTAKELAKKHEVHVFTSDRKNSLIIQKKEEKIGNIHIHRSKTWFRYGYYLAFYPGLVMNLLKYNLDIIHVHSIGFLVHDKAVLLKKLQSPKTKFIVTPHGPVMAQKNYAFWKKILKALTINFEKLTNKVYDKVIQVNPYQEKWLTKEYSFPKEKIIYIPNGINKEIFKQSKGYKTVNKYNLKNRFIISYVGRLNKYKGVQDVITVLPNLIKKKNMIFVVIGRSGDYLEELKKMTIKLRLENHVKFLTDCSDSEKEAILDLSEIFIMPSEWEAFGIAILEAMVKRNAVISTKTEGGKFLVEKNNGLLYNFGDTKTLEKNMIKLATNAKLRKSMQENNFKKAKQFTWDKITLKIEEEYKKL